MELISVSLGIDVLSGTGAFIMLALIVAAFAAGYIDSIAGGGGLISLPAMLVVGLPAQTALGTGKFMASLGTTAAFFTYARNGAINWQVAGIGVGFAFIGSALGARLALYVDNGLLGKIILILLPVAAVLTLLPVRRQEHKLCLELGKINPLLLYLATPLLCLGIGFYDGFFGPGTGSFLLLALHFLLGLGLVSASGTAKAFNLASNISSLCLFLYYGKIDFIFAIPMAMSNMAGNIAGARFALRGGEQIVRRMLFVSLSLLFVTLLWRYIF